MDAWSRFALVTLAILLPGRVALAGRPEAVLPDGGEAAAAAACAAPGDFVFVVDRHALVEAVTATAEGLVDGQRRTISLSVRECADQATRDVGHPHGRVLVAVPRAWPASGAWRVRVTLTYRLSDGVLAGSEVLFHPSHPGARVVGPRHFVEPSASPRRYYEGTRFTEEEIAAILGDR
jgi:hypothetical protein